MTASTNSKRIQRLPPVLVDRIAAGEVIDAPYSVIKELVENSLDAGATRIVIETRAAGADLIHVEDNGAGIHAEDLPASLERHATSKISNLEDLETILSFGFRGEALAAIASVSHIAIRSRRADAKLGALIESRGGDIERNEAAACNPGAVIQVRDLFYATPARRKHLKSERTENIRIYQQILRLALARPDVQFIYKRDDKEFLNLPAVGDLRDRIAAIYQSKLERYLQPVEAESGGLRLHGYVAGPEYHRANRDGQFQFINGRSVEIRNFSYLVRKAYGELLPPGAHPYFFLFLDIDPARVDVNVHPAKREVRLLDESLLHGLVVNSIARVLRPNSPLSFSGFSSLDHAPRVRHNYEPAASDQSILIEQPFSAGGEAYEIQPAARRDMSWSALAPGEILDESGEILAPDVSRASQTSHASGAASADDAADSRGRAFLPRRHFGVIFGAYILAEGDDGLYIIDQHTAHERINYEKMRSKMEALRSQRQPLLHPFTIDCLPDELRSILERRAELLESGFLIEEFGPRSYIVREVPGYLEPGGEQEVMVHLIHRILEGETGVRLYDEYAAMKACKASIKRNDYVSGPVLSDILQELAACENPSRCPHGRPTMIKITPDELDRLFYRA